MCHKAKSLAVEAITTRTQGKIEATNYNVEERNLINYGHGSIISAQAPRKENLQTKEPSNVWKLRLKE